MVYRNQSLSTPNNFPKIEGSESGLLFSEIYAKIVKAKGHRKGRLSRLTVPDVESMILLGPLVVNCG